MRKSTPSALSELDAAEAAHDLATDAAELVHGTPDANAAYVAVEVAELRLEAAEDAAREGAPQPSVRTRIRPITIDIGMRPDFAAKLKAADQPLTGRGSAITMRVGGRDVVVTAPTSALDELAATLSARSTLTVEEARDRLRMVEKSCGDIRAIPLEYLADPLAWWTVSEWLQHRVVAPDVDPPTITPRMSDEIRQALDNFVAATAAHLGAVRGRGPEIASDPEVARKRRAKRKHRAQLAKRSKRKNRR